MALKLPSSTTAFRRFCNSAATAGSLRGFHCSVPRPAGSPLLNLSGLSISRESQYFSKERGIPRTEFSPHLELIRSSEVAPFTSRNGPSSQTEALPEASESKTTSGQRTYNLSHDKISGSSGHSACIAKELECTREILKLVKEEQQRLRDEISGRNTEAFIFAFIILALSCMLILPGGWQDLRHWYFGCPEKTTQSNASEPEPQLSRRLDINLNLPHRGLEDEPLHAVIELTPRAKPAEPVMTPKTRLSGFFWAPSG